MLYNIFIRHYSFRLWGVSGVPWTFRVFSTLHFIRFGRRRRKMRTFYSVFHFLFSLFNASSLCSLLLLPAIIIKVIGWLSSRIFSGDDEMILRHRQNEENETQERFSPHTHTKCLSHLIPKSSPTGRKKICIPLFKLKSFLHTFLWKWNGTEIITYSMTLSPHIPLFYILFYFFLDF